MANKTFTTKISLRNDTAANWTTANPIMLKGEMGIEIDTSKFKFGDGTTAWNGLGYASASAAKIRTADPTSSDTGYDIGTAWVNTTSNTAFLCLKNTSPATWLQVITSGITASSATKLATARTIGASGSDVTSTPTSFDGTSNILIPLTLGTTGVAAGTYAKVTVDTKGRITAGTVLSASDIPTLTLSKISNAGTAASKDTGTSSGNVPVLGAGGKLDPSILPAIAITETFVVASQADMLSLTAQTGDVAVRTDVKKSFILTTEGASTLANWQELLTPTDAVLSVNGKTGTVTLAKSDIGLGNVDNTADASKSVASAAKLTTARTINGVSFDGTANITVADNTKEPAFTKKTAFNKDFGAASGTVCQGNDSRLSDSRPASDVPSWAKAATKPTYTKSEIGLSKVDNVKQYSADNPPPYPVTSVNSKTGAVTLVASDVGALPDSTVVPQQKCWYGTALSPAVISSTYGVSLNVQCGGYVHGHIDTVGQVIFVYIPSGLLDSERPWICGLNINNGGVAELRKNIVITDFDQPHVLAFLDDGTQYTAVSTSHACRATEALSLLSTCAVEKGGTGLNSLTAGSYLVGNGTDDVTLKTPAQVLADILAAPLASPALTGTPTAPTAAVGTNTTQIATTAFAKTAATNAAAAINIPVTSVNSKTGAVSLTTSDIAEGTNQYYTAARFNTAFAAKSSSDLSNGVKIATTEDVLILNGGNASGN